MGLGGSGDQSSSLEQTGTQADCNADGSTDYYAWYELVPAAPVQLDLAIHPGDHISAKVSVNGTNVTVSLTDQTTGQSANKTLQMDSPDTSSAEWIAEAPSACDGSGCCQPLPLSDFGTVQFTGATATADGHTGTISDSNWSAQPVTLGSAAVPPTSASSPTSSRRTQAPRRCPPTARRSRSPTRAVVRDGWSGRRLGRQWLRRRRLWLRRLPGRRRLYGDGYGGYPGGYGQDGYGGDGYGGYGYGAF